MGCLTGWPMVLASRAAASSALTREVSWACWNCARNGTWRVGQFCVGEVQVGEPEGLEVGAQVGFLVVVSLTRRSRRVRAATGSHDDSRPAGQRQPGERDLVDPRLERGGDREVVHRAGDQHGIRRKQLLDERPRYRPASFLGRPPHRLGHMGELLDACCRRLYRDLGAGLVDRRHRVGAEVTVGVATGGVDGAPFGNEGCRDLAGERRTPGAGVDVEQTGHGNRLLPDIA